MAHKLYLLTLRWVKTPSDYKVVEAAINHLEGTWLRFNAHFWLVWTTATSKEIASALRAKLQTDDAIIVMTVNPDDFQGFAAPWIWDWIRDKANKLKHGL